ncbi:MAG: hypothetical protein F6J93_22780 [Oscillatoria sp. SIO1A7]|nr:hypothetical protein [Oscillatoria sp. SIO1A7]
MINAISGDNIKRWLSDDELRNIGNLLGINDISVVIFNTDTNEWMTVQGNPANSENIIGAVPSTIGGEINHWVVLRRQEGNDQAREVSSAENP